MDGSEVRSATPGRPLPTGPAVTRADAGVPHVRWEVYTQFCERFLPLRHSFTLVAEWVSETSVAQEYDVSLRVDGRVETHRVLGVLYASGGLLAGERVYASERFIRLMTGDLFDELERL